MTTPQAPGAPEAGQIDGAETTPGAPEQAPQQNPAPQPSPQRLGRPNQQGHPQAPGAPAQQPSDEPAKQDDNPQTVESLPEWAQKLIRDARADAGKARTSAKQQAATEARQALLDEFAQKLGLNPDAEPTVEDLSTQLAERQQRIDELEAAQTQHTYESAVRTAASAANADAEALLDSAGFLEAVQAELGDDFDDAALAEACKKVTTEYAKKPRFALSTAPARSGGEITGGPPPPTKQRPKSLNAAVGRQYGLG